MWLSSLAIRFPDSLFEVLKIKKSHLLSATQVKLRVGQANHLQIYT